MTDPKQPLTTWTCKSSLNCMVSGVKHDPVPRGRPRRAFTWRSTIQAGPDHSNPRSSISIFDGRKLFMATLNWNELNCDAFDALQYFSNVERRVKEKGVTMIGLHSNVLIDKHCRLTRRAYIQSCSTDCVTKCSRGTFIAPASDNPLDDSFFEHDLGKIPAPHGDLHSRC